VFKKFIPTIFVLVVALTGGYFLSIHPEILDSPVLSYVAKNGGDNTAGPAFSRIKLAFVGDIMLDRDVSAKDKKFGTGDLSFVFDNVRERLESYDILFGNLEGPVSDKGLNRGSKYSFRMKPEAAEAIAGASFDIVSVANNHIGDWGKKAMADTFSRLLNADVKIVGGGENESEAYGPVIFEKNGVKIAFLAFSQMGKGYLEVGNDSAGIAIISDRKVASSTAEAKEQADIVVASFHFGEEYQKTPNEYQKRVVRLAIDNGADIVIGHHPHIVQTVENYKEGWIAYSLGNFVFDQPFSEETMSGALAEVTISNKKISDFKLVPVKINKDYQPEIVEE